MHSTETIDVGRKPWPVAADAPSPHQEQGLITVFGHRYVRAWPRHAAPERGEVLSLADALTRSYVTDAHFAQYRSPNGTRLCSDSIGQCEIRLDCIAFDLDCPESHGTGAPAPESWRAQLRVRMKALYDAHPSLFYYETRGGARIVWRQSVPTFITGKDDARTWAQEYAICVAYLERRFGLRPDPACADWQRLFRLPRATRDRGGAPENWLEVGDPGTIGKLLVTPTEQDFSAAKARSKAFKPVRALAFAAPNSAAGEGLFYRLLAARGAVIRGHGANAYVIRCPREAQHSCGRTGDGSTLLYAPAIGAELGAIHCKHAHCVDLSASEWLEEFSREEREAARNTATAA